MIYKRLFAQSGAFPAYHMYGKMHFLLILASAVCVFYTLYRSRHMEKGEVLQATRRCTWLLWTLEIIKIIFNLCVGNGGNPNTYIPLYFCSLTLYCGLLSGYGRGTASHIGNVFLVVGGLVGGAAYLLMPSTTAGTYPAFHFITIQSYIHHSVMIYLSILYIQTGYIQLQKKDILYYAGLVTAASLLAYLVNLVLGTNLMFVSQNHPGTAVDLVYSMSPTLFPFMMTFWQAAPPFVVVRALQKFCNRKIRKRYFAEI